MLGARNRRAEDLERTRSLLRQLSQPDEWNQEALARARRELAVEQERRSVWLRRRAARRRVARRLLAVTTILTVLAGGVIGLAWMKAQPTSKSHGARDTWLLRPGQRARSDSNSEARWPLQRPTPGYEASTSRLAPVVTPPVLSGEFSFLEYTGGEPLRWDPCRSIHYVYNEASAPSDARALLKRAVGRIAEASGLVFVDDGETDEPVDFLRAPFQNGRYGDRWAPILVGWASPDEIPEMEGALGRGGPDIAVRRDGTWVSVTGIVVLNAEYFAAHRSEQDDKVYRNMLYEVLLHELGHVMGLGHVRTSAEVMSTSSFMETPKLGPGDQNGLAILGAGECSPDL